MQKRTVVARDWAYRAALIAMLLKQLFDEIRVYDGVAERTGVQFEREAVRRSGGYCRSLTELIRKARNGGDGYYYLPLNLWPADTERVELQKRWVVMSSPSLGSP